MLCEECGQREATIHLTTVVNGVRTEKHLCAVCSDKKQQETLDLGVSIGDILAAFLGGGESNAPVQQAQADIRCATCGLTLESFKKNGLLGCPDCYSVFKANLLPILRRVHGAQRHTGRGLDNRPVEAVGTAGEVQAEVTPNDTEQIVRELRLKLAQSIEVEDYEQAAVLRDRIKALESTVEESA